MTAAALATYLGRILEAHDVRALSTLAAEIRRAHPSDPEPDVVARQAEMKRTRIVREG